MFQPVGPDWQGFLKQIGAFNHSITVFMKSRYNNEPFLVVHLVAKLLNWSEAEGGLVVTETNI